jgi:hypothetical protein
MTPAVTQLTDEERKREIRGLEEQAKRLNWYLLSVILVFLGASVWLGTYGSRMEGAPWWGIALSIVAATLGSGVAAIQSAQQRRANGWEFSNSEKYPTAEPKDKFNAGMVDMFYTRPFLGSAVGAAFYFGAPTVFGFTAPAESNPGKLAFWSFVVGVLAKTFLETLKDLFKKLGKSA